MIVMPATQLWTRAALVRPGTPLWTPTVIVWRATLLWMSTALFRGAYIHTLLSLTVKTFTMDTQQTDYPEQLIT